ncbi:MAG: aspartyl protease family protein [Planctomycetota bacterium]
MLLPVAVQAQLSPTADQVREKVQKSCFGSRSEPVLIQGGGEQMGVDMTYWAILHPDGRFVMQTEGLLPGTSGFDGKTCWSVDWGGTPQTLRLSDRHRTLATTWFPYGLALQPDGPITFSLDESSEMDDDDEGVLVAGVRVGDFESRLLVNRESWLPVGLEYKSEAGTPVRQTFADHRQVLGVTLPFFVSSVQEGGFVDEFRIDSVQEAPRTLADPFAPRQARPTDMEFDPDQPSEVKVRRVPSGHILIRASLDGGDERWFILDSGAGAMCISPEVADEFEMESFGKVPAAGVGGLTVSRFRRGASLTVGPLYLANPTFVELDLAFLEPLFGVEIAGICGFGLFSRAVVVLDLKQNTLALHDPDQFQLENPKWEDLILYSRHPVVRASFEGDHAGLLRIDTGAGGTVTFHANSVKKYALLEDRETNASAAGGVGGMIQMRTGQIAWFELGGHRFEHPSVDFAIEDKGAFSDEDIDGNLGTRFLEPFRLVFDYANERIAFVERKP